MVDDREIIYFDPVPTPRTAVDRREIQGVPLASDVRFDSLLGEPVVIAAHRQSRTFLPPTDRCPLCPSTMERATEIPEHDYAVVSLENRFPALERCEVVCFTSDHHATFASLSFERARLVVDVWADRSAELGARPGVAQVFCFENYGSEIGVTLSHPHGQIYAYPFITPRTRGVLELNPLGGSLFADYLALETATDERVVVADEHWVAFVPKAARWPYEVLMFPRRRVANIPELVDAERDSFVRCYLDVLNRFAHRFAEPMPYVAAWHQAPVAHRSRWWLHLQVFSIRRAADKLKYLAASESAMGVFINDTIPEAVAAELRAVTW
ncbi:galactose-1-phosphate uridylyltransferase [Skermania sp. ID1734]|uniref:galactose-1-phosphate uridylyltransferase n=1 Tax=Skermania sp. ID1734 TaxID=2597516 RepID=UPI00163DCCE1|nr:galactose-1-phosphate uridylyltransferase [Skermania sp. ID1734]